MKLISKIFTALLFTAFFTGTNAQDLSFDMEVYEGTASKEAMTMKVMASGSKIALVPQTPGQGKMTILIDNATSKQHMLMDMNGQKMAMAIPSTSGSKGNEAKEPKITVTNEKKVIDGYNCTKVMAETDDHISELWLSEDVGLSYTDLFRMLNSTNHGSKNSMSIPEMKNMKGFPVEMVAKNKAKGNSTTMRIKNISKAKVPAGTFSMEGYKMMDMNNPGH